MTDAHILGRAQLLLQTNRPEQALAELAHLTGTAALSMAAVRLRAAALADLERWYEVIDVAGRGLTDSGPDPALYGLLGRAHDATGDPTAAERALLAGLALDAEDVFLLTTYAFLCAGQGQLRKAEALCERAAAVAPQAARVYATRVHLARAAHDDRRAQQIAGEYLAEYPDDPLALALVGSLNAARGQYGPAYDHLRQAVVAEPTEQRYAEAALELKLARHPLLIPIRPILRFGALPTWAVAVVIMFGLRYLGFPTAATIATIAWIALCVYSWVVPPLLTRHLKKRQRSLE